MIYRLLSGAAERLLSIPPVPTAPPGDEGTTRVFRASPRFYLYRLLAWGVRRGFGVLVVTAAGRMLTESAQKSEVMAPLAPSLMALVLSVYGLQTLMSWVALRLDYEKRWYLVTDRSLRIRQGVMAVSEMTITFANIQNLSISQGPLQRLFGISDLRVDTAGGSSVAQVGEHAGASFHTAFFEGVDNAEQIRELVQGRLRRVRDAGLGDPDDRDAATGVIGDPVDERADHASGDGPLIATGRGDGAALEVLRELRTEARALRASATRLPG